MCHSAANRLLHTVLTSVLILGFVVVPGSAAEEKPNVIVILADDLGYGDVSSYGHSSIETPNIDRLANNGIRFTAGYASASTCTPTRYSLLTGEYAFREPGTGIAPPNATSLVKPGVPTVASVLKKAGYHTAVVGKWHLGLGSGDKPDWNGRIAPGPLEIGFDYSFLLPTTNDRVPSVYVKNHRVKDLNPDDPLSVGGPDANRFDEPTGKEARERLKMDWDYGHNDTIHNGIGRIGYMSGGHSARWMDEELAAEWVRQSRNWIKKHRDEPFFLFFSSHDIHVPRMPHPRFQGESGHGYRGDALLELDWSVGKLLEILDRQGLTEETLIVFCSDNGPVLNDGYKDGAEKKLGNHDINGPYRDGKYSIYEGGTRTPFITYWPGEIEPDVSDRIVSTMDLPASLAALADQPVPENAFPDSQNVLPALLGKPSATGRSHMVQQNNSPENLSLRIGPWKLVAPGTDQSDQELYNLNTDPGEQNNLIKEKPSVAQQLREQLQRIQKADGTRGMEFSPIEDER